MLILNGAWCSDVQNNATHKCLRRPINGSVEFRFGSEIVIWIICAFVDKIPLRLMALMKYFTVRCYKQSSDCRLEKVYFQFTIEKLMSTFNCLNRFQMPF